MLSNFVLLDIESKKGGIGGKEGKEPEDKQQRG
jgi:hypothetical protein